MNRENRPPRGWSRYKAARAGIPIRNARNTMDGLLMLKSLDDRCASLVWFDPQYRGVLDHLAFGNEGARQKRRAELKQMSDATISAFVREIARVLAWSGHLMMWCDKHTLGAARHLHHLEETPQLAVVDLMTWDTKRFGMGKRTRSVAEFCIVIQKPPLRAKGIWTDRAMRDIFSELSDRTAHPHAKPRVQIERIIRAVTKPGDLVVDPCAGSYVVLDACAAAGRQFLGCDIAES